MSAKFGKLRFVVRNGAWEGILYVSSVLWEIR